MAKPYEVLLSNVGNPDFHQVPGRKLPETDSPKWKRAADFEEASALCRAYIDENNLGGGNWSGGLIRDTKTKAEVGRVAYNGRVFPPGEWKSGVEPLWEPGASTPSP